MLINKLHKEIFKIKKFYKNCKKPLNLHEPFLDNLDKKFILSAVRNKSVSTVGNETIKFERELKRFTKSKYLVATSSGTAALHLALLSLNIKKGSEILMPSLNYIAAANCCLYAGLCPHFIDISKDNIGIDFKNLEIYLENNTTVTNKKCINKKNNKLISAIIVPHLYGHIYEIEKLNSLSKKFKFKIIEDAAEAFGSYYKKKHAGTFGHAGILSFNGNKIITTGGGGAVIFREKKNYLKAFHLATISKKKHKYEYEYTEVGYNYRMPSINAALGLSQIKKIRRLISLKKDIYKKIFLKFSNSKIFTILNEPKNCKSNYWLITIILKKPFSKFRNIFIKDLHKNRILVRPIWRALNKSPYLNKYNKMDLKNTFKLEERIINLPSSPDLNRYLK